MAPYSEKMLVKIRNCSNFEETKIKISATASIAELKDEINKKLSVNPDFQRLYYSGKHLELENTLFDYKVNASDVIQLMVKSKDCIQNNLASSSANVNQNEIKPARVVKEDHENLIDVESDYYAVGDLIDCLDSKYGAWFEATIKRICNIANKLMYLVEWDLVKNAQPFYVSDESIRPRAHKVIENENLKIGERVMVNHNLDQPSKIGFWYDYEIKKIFLKNNQYILSGILHIGKNGESLSNLKIQLKQKVYAVEKPKLLKSRDLSDEKCISTIRRAIAPDCHNCSDRLEVKCTECGCRVCGGKNNPHLVLLCDECEDEYHISCLKPPLLKIPDDDWYCAKCKNDENEIVKMGQLVKKRSLNNFIKRSSNYNKCFKNVIKRKKNVPTVPKNHKGAIPGIEVGSYWENRMQLSKSGVHVPPMAGIHGRMNDCAYSLILSGNYNDIDNGNEFVYSGSGGRNNHGACGHQILNQTLTRANKALALNCNAKFNDEVGATATDWRAGIPVRVVRNYKLSKFSKYAPIKGNRYDGLYKVVKYYPEVDKNGLCIWRYLLKRDDPTPPPWTLKGGRKDSEIGLNITEAIKSIQRNSKKVYKKKNKHREEKHLNKKNKINPHHLNSNVSKLIDKDVVNFNLWQNCKSHLPSGKKAFLKYVLLSLQCVCCHDLVSKPVTTPCKHNICQSCLEKSFSAGLKFCPTCRFSLKSISISVNKKLAKILSLLFPKYNRGKK